MSPTFPISPVPANRPPGGEACGGEQGDATALRERRLDELERLLAAGMETVRQISQWSKGALGPDEVKVLAGKGGIAEEYVRVARAIRQVIVLEQELMGLRPGPPRDGGGEPPDDEGDDDHEAELEERSEGSDLRDRAGDYENLNDYENFNDYENLNDYDRGPLDRVIARVRKALRVEAPEDDPFAPPAERRSRPAPTRDEGGADGAGRDGSGGEVKTVVGEGALAPSGSRQGAANIGPVTFPRGRRQALLSGAASGAMGLYGRSRGPPE